MLAKVNADIPATVQRVQDSGNGSLQYDVDCTTLDGKAVSMNLNAVPLVDPNGTKMGVVLVLDDITSEKRVKSRLQRYMSKDVVEQLLAGEGNLALGGVRQEVSVLFSDIRSYTTLTESQGAHEIVGMLNEYFSYMVDVIFEHEGILDKFIGDAIMAVFGAPFSRPEVDPANAVNAGLEMMQELARYNRERVARGQIAIDAGVGISSGEVVCGNIGSEKRMDYTVIGDGVNLASRLEGATKMYGASIMMSEFTNARVADKFVTRKLDVIQVKGKTQGVGIYEVFARAGEPIPDELKRRLDVVREGAGPLPGAQLRGRGQGVRRRTRGVPEGQGLRPLHRALRLLPREPAGRGLERRLGAEGQVAGQARLDLRNSVGVRPCASLKARLNGPSDW